MQLRWGICGFGEHCQDFVTALRLLSHRHTVVAVAASNEEPVFVEGNNISVALKSYDDLMKCSQINIIYVGVDNAFHKNLVLNALNNGKHVLCRKPMGVNANEVKQMVKLAREKKLFLMEGYWSRFFPVYRLLRTELDKGTIGEPQLVTANFGTPLHADELSKDLGSCTLLTTGCYCTMLSTFVFKEKPTEIIARGNQTSTNDTTNVILLYDNGKMFQFMNSSSLTFKNRVIIYGLNGQISLPHDFWCPTKVVTMDGAKSFPLPQYSSDIEFNYLKSEGYLYEAEAVRECIASGKTECSEMSLGESIIIAEINDAIRKQIGINFPQDDEIDKEGHHKVLPKEEVQMHREGKIDKHGRTKSSDTNTPSESRPVYFPFDELAMKQSGYPDDHCQHLTEVELNKKRTPVSCQKHVDTDNISIQTSIISSRETPRSTLNDTGEQKSAQRSLPQNEAKLERKGKSKPSSRRSYKLKLKGTLNLVENGSNKAQPSEKPASSERKKQQEKPVKAESDQKQAQLSSDTLNKDTDKKSPKREPAKPSSQRSSKKERPKSKASKRRSQAQPPESQVSSDAAKVEQNKPVETKYKEKPKESSTGVQTNKDTRKKLSKRDSGKSSSRKSSKKRPQSKLSKDVPRSQPPEKQPGLAVAKVEDQRESAGKKYKDVGPTELEKKPSKRQKSKRDKSTQKQGDE